MGDVNKNVNVRVTARDEASATFDRVGASARRMGKAMETPAAAFGPAVKPRFDAIEQETRDRVAGRVKAMREAARRANVDEDVNRRLFGDATGTGKQAEGLKKVGEEAAKAGKPVSALWEILRKFATSKGTDTMLEKLVKVAPAAVAALAVVKAATLGFELLNLNADMRRHRSQGNLDRMAEDERKANEAKRSVPVLGPLVEQLADSPLFDYFGLSNFHKDKVAIENLEDATKAQEALIARQQERAEKMKALRDSSRNANDQISLTLAQRDQSPERAAVLAARNQLDLFNRTLGEQVPGAKLPKEALEQRALLEKQVNAAIEDEAKAHGKRMVAIDAEFGQNRLRFVHRDREAERKTLSDALAAQLAEVKDAGERLAQARANALKLALFDQETLETTVKAVGALYREVRQSQLRSGGRGFQADLEATGYGTFDALLHEYDPGKRRAIQEKGDELERARRLENQREVEDDQRAHNEKLSALYGDLAARKLVMVGKGAEAERLTLDNGYRQQLEDIRDRLEKELRLHADREPELRRQAAEDARAAGESYGLSQDEIARREAMSVRSPLPGAVSGESRLLSGLLGAGGGPPSPLLEPTVRIAKAAEEARVVRQKMAEDIAAIKSALTTNPKPAQLIK